MTDRIYWSGRTNADVDDALLAYTTHIRVSQFPAVRIIATSIFRTTLANVIPLTILRSVNDTKPMALWNLQ